ncbi:MAG TPA: hypothetical protein VLL49_10595 [Anaerolineales bacterium]|nr:hypothetical protein [Anaerolineales bacterium]
MFSTEQSRGLTHWGFSHQSRSILRPPPGISARFRIFGAQVVSHPNTKGSGGRLPLQEVGGRLFSCKIGPKLALEAMKRRAIAPIMLVLPLSACATLAGVAPQAPAPFPEHSPVPVLSQTPSQPAPSPTATEAPPIATATSIPTIAVPVSQLGAEVTVGLLSCNYGPGPDYLYLYALREGANITLIGRTEGDNWHWVWVEGQNPCWVNTNYLRIDGDWRELPIVYPGISRLPISPYYPPPTILGVKRRGSLVTMEWAGPQLRAGDEEDEFMRLYVLELWHCKGGQLLFEPVATDSTRLTILDGPGCALPSHARLFFQEKHGFAGPVEVPWPPPQPINPGH